MNAPESRGALHELPLLRFLPAGVRELVADSFVPVPFSFGSPIVSEGEEATAFFVLASGLARVVKRAGSGEELTLNALKPGDSFGEIALLGGGLRTATVRASSEGLAFRLDRPVFDALVQKHPEIRDTLGVQKRAGELRDLFREHTAFSRLPAATLARFIAGLEEVHAHAGSRVVTQGDTGDAMYVVASGRLRAFVEDAGARRYLAYYRRGDFFGEVSLFKGGPRVATVEAVSDATLYRLTLESFDELVAANPQFRKRIEERVSQYDYRRTARVPLDFADELLPAQAAPREAAGAHSVHAEGDEPFAVEGRFVKRGKRIRLSLVRQIDEMDCGAAALAMVAGHFGRSLSLARIRQRVNAGTDGTSLSSLCRAADSLGLAARSVRASRESLAKMPLPAIAHWQGNHWVVLYEVGEDHVRVADPGLGLRRLPRAEFEEKWTGYAALFDYIGEAAPEGPQAAGVAWLWPFLRPHLPTLAKAVGLALVTSVLQMSLPVITQVIVDHVLVDRDAALLRVLMAAMLGVLGFIVVAMVVQRYLLSFAAVRIDSASLDFLTRRLLALPMSYFNARRTGDIQRRLEGMRQVREFMVGSGIGAATAAVQLAVALALMFAYSGKLALVFLVVAPLYAGLMYFSARWLRPIFDRLEEAFGRYHSYQIDAIKGIETVKAMGAEGSFRELMLREFHGLARRRFNADFMVMLYQGATQAVTFLSMILFLWAGAWQVMGGAMSIGGLVAFNSLVAMANAPLLTLLMVWDHLQLSAVLLDRLEDVLDHPLEQGGEGGGLKSVRTLEGRVAFRDLSFRYGGPDSPAILENISFEVPAGKRVAIVGRSGSGKTTLVKCLAGLVEPTGGTILYDGVDLRSLNYRELRRHIGFVLQENHLFDTTIAGNIAFGETDPDMDRVLWAARMANAHEFIDRLPLGYETRVGESGLLLSGGQRQRLAIARALFHRPPILVFDEATSALDTDSERAVKENLDTLLEGRTSFVIAHRMSTIRGADLILVLDKGRLAEQGTHDELMKRQGLYWYLCSQQLDVS